MRLLEENIREMVLEELTKQEVKNIIDDKIDDYKGSRDFKKKVREIAVDVLDDFFREMWRKNGFWKNPLKNN